MKTPLLPTLLALLAAACSSTAGAPADGGAPPAWNGAVERWGTLHEALRDGRDEGRVAVADVARPHVYAVGTLAGLAGEVTILDGETWISRGSAERATTVREPGAEQATVLVAAEVPAWREIQVTEAVDAAELDAFVEQQARAHGLDTSAPFPFVVAGGLVRLKLHVIGGECPIRARATGATLTAPPYELTTSAVLARLVGIYAEDASGIVCHGGSRTHVHAVLGQHAGGEGLTGHVETVGLSPGSRLYLPRR